MNPEQSKKLIGVFLIGAAIVGASVFLFSGGSGTPEKPAVQSAAQKSSVPAIGENAFVEEVPLTPTPKNKPDKKSTTSTENALPLQKSPNLTDNLANILSHKISGLNDADDFTQINAIADFQPEDIQSLVEQTTDLEKIKSEIVAAPTDTESPTINIAQRYIDEDLKKYADDVSAIFQQYLENDYLKDSLRNNDTRAVLSFSPIIFEQANLKLQALKVPEPLAEIHRKMLVVLGQLQDATSLMQDTADPLKSFLTLQAKDAEIKKSISALESEAQALQNSLSAGQKRNTDPYSLLFEIISPFQQLLRVNNAQAVFGFGDIVFDIPHTFLTAAGWAKDIATELWKFAYRLFLEQLKSRLITMIQNQLVAWIQGGGKPQFVTNIGQFLKDTGSSAAGFAIEQTVPGMCQPFQPLIRIAFEQQNYPVPPTTCTLGDVVNNLQGFYDNFETGGWIAYGQVLRPENNIWGVALQESAIIQAYQQKKQDEARQEITQGQGTKDQKSCQGTYQRTMTLGEYIGTNIKTDPNFVSGNGNPGCEGLYQDATGNGTETCEVEMCSLWGTKTPGAQISATIMKTIGSGLDRINAAQDIAGLISAVANALINRLTQEGMKLAQEVASGIVGGSQPGGLLSANLIVDANATECQTDADCQAKLGSNSSLKLQCVSGYCSASFAQGSQCGPSNPCPSGQACNSGFCAPQDCQKNADCGSNAICYRNSCLSCTGLNTPAPLEEQFCDIKTPNQKPEPPATSTPGVFWSATADCRLEVTKAARGVPLYMCAKGIKTAPPDSFGKVGGNCWPQKIKFAGYYRQTPQANPQPDVNGVKTLPYVSSTFLHDKYIKYGRFQAVRVDQLLTFTPKFTCSNNACVADPFGQYNAAADCAQACGGTGGGGGGGGGGHIWELNFLESPQSPLAQLVKTAFASIHPFRLSVRDGDGCDSEHPDPRFCSKNPPETYYCNTSKGTCEVDSTGNGQYGTKAACNAQCVRTAGGTADEPGYYYFTAKTNNYKKIKCEKKDVGKNKIDGAGIPCTEFETQTSKGASCVQNPDGSEDYYCAWNKKDGTTDPNGQPEFMPVVQKVQAPWVYVSGNGDDVCKINADCGKGQKCLRSGVGVASEDYRKYCVREAIAKPNETPAALWEIIKSAGETIKEECLSDKEFSSKALCQKDPLYKTTSTVQGTGPSGETIYLKTSHACRLGGCPPTNAKTLETTNALLKANASLTCNNNNKKDRGETGIDCGGGGCPSCGSDNDDNDAPPSNTIPDPITPEEQLNQLTACLSGNFTTATSTAGEPQICWRTQNQACKQAATGDEIAPTLIVGGSGCVEDIGTSSDDPSCNYDAKGENACNDGGTQISGKDIHIKEGNNGVDNNWQPAGKNAAKKAGFCVSSTSDKSNPALITWLQGDGAQYLDPTCGTAFQRGICKSYDRWAPALSAGADGCNNAFQVQCQAAFCAHTRNRAGWWGPDIGVPTKNFDATTVQNFCADVLKNSGYKERDADDLGYSSEYRQGGIFPGGETNCNDNADFMKKYTSKISRPVVSCSYWDGIEKPPTP